MSLSDPIGDMIARIKNATLRNYKKVQIPSSKFKIKIAEVLKMKVLSLIIKLMELRVKTIFLLI